MVSGTGMTFTKTFHQQPYPAIDPTRPELTQSGKTVLITGASGGIGLAIGRAFLQASASKVIVLGRRQSALDTAVSELNKLSSTGRAIGKVCDVSDPEASRKLWAELEREHLVVDVLILNAAATSDHLPLLELDTEVVWKDYGMNVRAHLDFTKKFYKQVGKGSGGPKYIVNVSTLAIHNFLAASDQPSYALTKNGGTLAMQLIARDTPAETVQIVNFNPGPNLTKAAKDNGYNENSFQWNNVDLSGHFAVWAASPEARFLHGRFVWAEWDVDELKTGEIRKRIDEDPFYLQIGVKGL